VFITTTTSGTPTSSSTRVSSSGGGSSTTYTITSSDALSPVNVFRAFATASNSAGTSSIVQSANIITATAASTVPGTVNSLTATSLLSGSNLNWSASWSAPTSDGGAAITGYRVYVERAGSQTGPWIATTTQSPAGTGAFTQASPRLVSSATTSVSGRVTGTAATWIRVWVAAVNSVGTGTYVDAVG
jgi:titin